jgi:hypothetical protein
VTWLWLAPLGLAGAAAAGCAYLSAKVREEQRRVRVATAELRRVAPALRDAHRQIERTARLGRDCNHG